MFFLDMRYVRKSIHIVFPMYVRMQFKKSIVMVKKRSHVQTLIITDSSACTACS